MRAVLFASSAFSEPGGNASNAVFVGAKTVKGPGAAQGSCRGLPGPAPSPASRSSGWTGRSRRCSGCSSLRSRGLGRACIRYADKGEQEQDEDQFLWIHVAIMTEIFYLNTFLLKLFVIFILFFTLEVGCRSLAVPETDQSGSTETQFHAGPNISRDCMRMTIATTRGNRGTGASSGTMGKSTGRSMTIPIPKSREPRSLSTVSIVTAPTTKRARSHHLSETGAVGLCPGRHGPGPGDPILGPADNLGPERLEAIKTAAGRGNLSSSPSGRRATPVRIRGPGWEIFIGAGCASLPV